MWPLRLLSIIMQQYKSIGITGKKMCEKESGGKAKSGTISLTCGSSNWT